MESLPVHVFKHSFGPFINLLNEHDVKYIMREQRSAGPMAGPGVIEVLLSPYMWGALSTIIVAFLKYRNSRKVVIKMKDGESISAEGLTQEDLENILERATSITAIETKPD